MAKPDDFDDLLQALINGDVSVGPRLPDWEMRVHAPNVNGYACDDTAEMQFADAVDAMTAFNLPEFDRWLVALPSGDERNAFVARREWARRAASGGDEEALRRHLEWMYVHRQMIEQRAALLPIVERDQKRQAGTRKPRKPDIDAWIARKLRGNPDSKSPDLWMDAPDWITDAIGFDRFRKRVTQARKIGRK